MKPYSHLDESIIQVLSLPSIIASDYEGFLFEDVCCSNLFRCKLEESLLYFLNKAKDSGFVADTLSLAENEGIYYYLTSNEIDLLGYSKISEVLKGEDIFKTIPETDIPATLKYSRGSHSSSKTSIFVKLLLALSLVWFGFSSYYLWDTYSKSTKVPAKKVEVRVKSPKDALFVSNSLPNFTITKEQLDLIVGTYGNSLSTSDKYLIEDYQKFIVLRDELKSKGREELSSLEYLVNFNREVKQIRHNILVSWLQSVYGRLYLDTTLYQSALSRLELYSTDIEDYSFIREVVSQLESSSPDLAESLRLRLEDTLVYMESLGYNLR